MGYRMFLKATNTLEIPVLPESLKVDSPGGNRTETVLGLGEVNLLDQKKLLTLGWEGIFPARPAPFVTAGALLAPVEYVRLLQSWREEQAPVRFLLVGHDLDCNLLMGIEDFTYEERGGEPGDLYYSLKLREYKDTAPRRLVLNSGKPVLEKAVRTVGREAGSKKAYVVQPGDTLWLVARKVYGDGERYPEIHAANQNKIDAANLATGAPGLTIWPGQKLVIP